MYLGDFATGSTVLHKFNTRDSSGAPITFAGSPALSVYKSNEVAEATHGLTLTVDFDSRTGFHQCVIDTTQGDGYYAGANDYRVVVTAGTVDGVSVVGETVFSFSLANRSALRPTVAGRTADVSAGGCLGVDWANVESPTTTVALTNTTVGTVSNVTAVGGVTVYDSDFTLSAADASTITLPATDAAGNAIPDNEHDWCVFQVVGGTGVNQPVLTTTRAGARQYNLHEALTTTLDNTSKLVLIGKWLANARALSDDTGAADNLEAALDGTGGVTITAALTGDVTGNLSGSVGSVTGAVGSVTGNVGGNVTGSVGSISGVSFPSNFSALGISASGHVSRVTLCDTVTTATTATNLTNAPTAGDFTATMKASIGTAVAASAVASVTGAVGSVTGNVGGNVAGSVGSVTGAVGSVTAGVTVTTNNDKTGYSLAAAGLDAVLVEASISAGAELVNDSGAQLTSINARQALALHAAVLAGVLSGAATVTNTIRPAGKPASSARVSATVDSDGNRSALTIRLPD